MDALFTNDTEIEKVASYNSFNKEAPQKNFLILFLASFVITLIVILIIVVLPKSMKVTFGLLLAGMDVIAVVSLWVKAPKTSKKDNSSISEMGLIRTGESDKYHYDFYEDRFSVSGSAEADVKYTDILSVRDIGGAFQIKTSERSYTVKKTGFPNENKKSFRKLMEKNNIIIS